MHPSFRLPFPEQRSSAIGKLSIVLMYASIYLKDYASIWISTSVVSIVLAIGLSLGIAAWAMRRSTSVFSGERASMIVLAWLIITWVLSTGATGILNTSSYYIAVPCAVVIINIDPRLFLRLMLAHFALTIVVQGAEYYSEQYLFIYQATDGTELDEALFGGSLDIFRAKGMFQGPLSAVAFGMWMAFLLRGNVPIAALLLISSFLASGRLGMLTALLLLAFRLLNGKRSAGSRRRQFVLLLGLIGIFVALFLTSNENRLFFISSALDVDNDQNVSRVFIWLTALSHYLSFGPIELMFGNFGFINNAEGATESDFLRLLLDCGLLGLLLYAGAVAVLLVKAAREKDAEDGLVVILIIMLMNIFPFVQSLSSAVLFWIYIQSVLVRRIWGADAMPT